MPGLVFDDLDYVDPNTSLLGPFREWVDVLAARRSNATTSGYVSDAGVFARALLDVLGKPGPEDPPEDELRVPKTLIKLGTPVVPVRTYCRTEVAVGALALRDLHPRNCGRALDSLGSTRSAATQRRMASAWSSLCGMLVRRGLLAMNPMEHDAVELPPRPESHPKPLDYKDAEALLHAITTPDPAAHRPWPARDFALASVLLTAGLRVSEACGAYVGDMRAVAVSPRLEVIGKGNKHRTIPLDGDAVVTAIRTYLDERDQRLEPATGNDPLFVRANGRPFDPRAMRRLVERWYLRAGVRRIPGSCVHALRHTFATFALDSGASVVEVQKLLGHSSLETTSVYLAVVGKGLEQTIAAHPNVKLVRAASTDDANIARLTGRARQRPGADDSTQQENRGRGRRGEAG